MKSSLLFVLGCATLWLAGCSTPTKVDSGPIYARTFSFVVASPKPAEFVDKREAVHGLIQDAITKNLEAKGVKKVAAGGDVTLAYLIIVGNPVTTTVINDYFGYNDDFVALIDKAQDAYTKKNTPNYFEAGTLVIDIVSATGKTAWRSYATRRLLGDVSQEARMANIQSAVDEALAGVRLTQ